MSAEDRGCCRHCIDGCKGVSDVWAHTAQEQPRDSDWPSKLTAYAVWQDGHCPICALANRIYDALEAEALAGAGSGPVLTARVEELRNAADIAGSTK